MKKGAMEFEELVKWIVAILLLVFLIGTIILLKGKEIGLIEKLKDFLFYG